MKSWTEYTPFKRSKPFNDKHAQKEYIYFFITDFTCVLYLTSKTRSTVI